MQASRALRSVKAAITEVLTVLAEGRAAYRCGALHEEP